MTTSRHGWAYHIDVEAGEDTLIARSDVPLYSAGLAAAGCGHAYVLQHQIRVQTAYYPIVVRA